MRLISLTKRLLWVVLIIFPCIQSTAQTRQEVISKFQKELHQDISDSLRVATLFKIAATYRRVNNDSALHYAKKTRELVKKSGPEKYLSMLDNLTGSLYMDISENDKALMYFHKARGYFQKTKNEVSMGISYNKLANLHRNIYNTDSALYYNIESLKIFEKYNRLAYALHAKNNIANIYNELGDKEKALKNHLEILKVRDSIQDVRGMMNSYGNLGDLYADMKDNEKALDYYSKGIAICIETQDSLSLARFYNNRASLYTDNREFSRALSEFEKSRKIRAKFNDVFGLSSVLNSVASIQLLQNKVTPAHKNLQKAITISKKYEIKQHLLDAYDLMSRVKLMRRENDSSFHYQQLARNLQEKIYGEEIRQEVAEMDAKYKTQKKEAALLKTQAEKAETELALNEQRMLSYSLIGGLGLLILLSYSLFQRNKRKHLLNIAQQKEEGLQAIIQAEENERVKIARDLHDGVVQQIGSAILKSRSVLESLQVIDKPESKELLKNLEDSNQDLRTISHQMMPRALNELGIVAALQDLLEGSLKLVNIESKFEHFNISERLTQKVEVTIYRVVQELINNIIKHSKASEVSVQLFKTGNNVILIIEDNGVGMSKENQKKGIGLLNISSRLDMVKGQVNFEPSPQSGTLVTIKIPT